MDHSISDVITSQVDVSAFYRFNNSKYETSIKSQPVPFFHALLCNKSMKRFGDTPVQAAPFTL